MSEINDGSLKLETLKATLEGPCCRCQAKTRRTVCIMHEDGIPLTDFVCLCWLCSLPNNPLSKREHINRDAHSNSNMTAGHSNGTYRAHD